MMTPFESAVRGSLEGSHGGRVYVSDDERGHRATPLSGTQLFLFVNSCMDYGTHKSIVLSAPEGRVDHGDEQRLCGAFPANCPAIAGALPPDITFQGAGVLLHRHDLDGAPGQDPFRLELSLGGGLQQRPSPTNGVGVRSSLAGSAQKPRHARDQSETFPLSFD